jgi:hypothetical protein
MRENQRPKSDPSPPEYDVLSPHFGARISKKNVSELTNAISRSGVERPQQEELFTYLLFCYVTVAYLQKKCMMYITISLVMCSMFYKLY